MEENKKPEKPMAFPSDAYENIKEGMTLRDYFAAKAMQAMISREQPNDGWSENASSQAYYIADTMLKERTKNQ